MTISVVPNKQKFFYKRWWFWPLVVAIILTIGAVAFFYKTGVILDKISSKDSSILDSLRGFVSNEDIKKTDDGRTNVLLLGMRGVNVPGGGLLADTIMIASFKDDEDKIALMSIPRDLYVKVPGKDYRSKINAVYAYGEENGAGNGISEMKKAVSEVTGLTIDYGVVTNFVGFQQLVDAVGGIEIVLETNFYETSQFVKGNECGGEFILPKGKNVLNGEIALCYARAREHTSDYDRAKRQQVILQALKDKLVSLGTLTDFSKVSKVLDALGHNVKTDMSSGEMKKFYSFYSGMNNPEIFQRVFENSPEGLLMVPQNVPALAGFVLIPRAGWDNYSEMHAICNNIFEIEPQSDIKPVKQYYRPAPKEVEKKKDKKDKDKKDK